MQIVRRHKSVHRISERIAIAAVSAAIFIVNKEEEENRETVLDLPNVLAVLYAKERRHIPRITGYADNCLSCTKHHRKRPRTFGAMKLEAMFNCVQKCDLTLFSGRDIFESAVLISLSAILDFHSLHSD